jgi:hypothetical protein
MDATIAFDNKRMRWLCVIADGADAIGMYNSCALLGGRTFPAAQRIVALAGFSRSMPLIIGTASPQ